MKVVQMKTGQAVKRSAKGGKQPVMLTHAIIIRVDNTQHVRAAKSKYLPHNGERKAARERRNHQRRLATV